MENGVDEPEFPANPLMGGDNRGGLGGSPSPPVQAASPQAQASVYPPTTTISPPNGSSYLRNLGSTETIDLDVPIGVDGAQPAECAFDISVTSPVRETTASKVPGVQDSYYTYLVNTSTTVPGFTNSEVSCRRRFRDFVDLSKLLRQNYRGYFVPPRPHRNMIEGKIRMSPTFIEHRRKSLEKYLKQLVAHPVISRSEELRVFLESRGQLRESLQWINLHPVDPPWYESAIKLMRQISGKERRVPSATEVVQPINPKRDILRSMKESMKSFKEKRAPTIHGEKEQALRTETDTMQEFKAAVDQSWKWASYWMDRVEAVGMCHDKLGKSLNALHVFESENDHVKLPAADSVQKGCIRAMGLHHQLVNQCAGPLSHLHDYTELVVSVLKALQAREEALNTVTTLQGDLTIKQARLATLKQTPGSDRKIGNVEFDINALEQSIKAAQSSYDRVSAHNTQEMTRLRAQRQQEFSEMLLGLAMSQEKFATQMAGVWCQIAEDLGADCSGIRPVKDVKS